MSEQNADSERLPDWLRAWRCPPCDDGISGLPCECFDVMDAIERHKGRQAPAHIDSSGAA